MPPESAATDSAAPGPEALEQAADWMLRLHSGDAGDADRAACEAWQRATPANALAWARVERLQQLIDRIPREVALPALERAESPDRRQALKRLATLAAAIPGAWLAYDFAADRGWQADQRTATGERRSLRLPDGSLLELNTATAVDIRFDAGQRALHLHRGEILVETATDPQPRARPFAVTTPSARLQALGTRFGVRLDRERGRLAVLEGAVRIEPAHGRGATVLQAGQQAWFDPAGTAPIVAADETIVAWRHGMLVADRMAAGELVAELARHRRGVLRCDPDAAALRVSGAFPLDDTDRSLQMLAAAVPVRIRRTSGYWLVVETE